MSTREGPEDRPFDIGALITVLARHGVEYVAIGGLADQVHGYGRATMNFEMTPAPDSVNLARLGAALAVLEAQPLELGLEKIKMSAADFERLALVPTVPPLLTRHGQIHILKEPKGAHDFRRLREAALVIDIDGANVAVASLDDLIRMKRAAGRSIDIEDVAALTGAENQRRD